MFDFWPVYSDEQFRASWPSCLFSYYFFFFLKGKIIIIKQKMECGFLRVGDNEPCHLQPTKNSKYCGLPNFFDKKESSKTLFTMW